MFTIQDIMDKYGVMSWRETGDNLVAIRKGKMWLYFQWRDEDTGYIRVGSTDHFEY